MEALAGLFLRLFEPVLKAIGGPLYNRYQRHALQRDIRATASGKIGVLLTTLGRPRAFRRMATRLRRLRPWFETPRFRRGSSP